MSILIDKCLLWWYLKQKGHTNSLHQNSLEPLQWKSLQKMGFFSDFTENPCESRNMIDIVEGLIEQASAGKCIQGLFLNLWRSCLYTSDEYDDTRVSYLCGEIGQKTYYIGMTVTIVVWFLLLLLLIAFIHCVVKCCRKRD